MSNSLKKIPTEDIQSVLLNLLEEFHNICINNGLRYTLSFGTLLGAIRHKGFIPWDDDVDIIMPRSDYDRLIDLLDKSARYRVYSVDTIKGYASILPKFVDTNTLLIQKTEGASHAGKYDLGIYLDIFVIDKIPISKIMNNQIFFKFNLYQKVWNFFYFKPAGNHNLIVESIREKGNKLNLAPFIAKVINKEAKRTYKGEKFLWCNLLQGGFSRWKYIFTEDDFKNLICVEFENKQFYVISNYDYYLSNWYGDYLKLPPASERVSNHSFDAYIKILE